MGKAGNGPAGQHLLSVEDRGHRHAGGGEVGDQDVSLTGGDGGGNGVLHLVAPTAAFVEVEVRQLAQPEMATEAGPEVLLVDHPQCDLPAVGGGEDAVAGHWSGLGRGPARASLRPRVPSTSP